MIWCMCNLCWWNHYGDAFDRNVCTWIDCSIYYEWCCCGLLWYERYDLFLFHRYDGCDRWLWWWLWLLWQLAAVIDCYDCCDSLLWLLCMLLFSDNHLSFRLILLYYYIFLPSPTSSSRNGFSQLPLSHSPHNDIRNFSNFSMIQFVTCVWWDPVK